MAYNLIVTDRADELIDYRVAYISDMQYKIIFRVDENKNYVYVVGLFHDLEDYGSKVID